MFLKNDYLNYNLRINQTVNDLNKLLNDIEKMSLYNKQRSKSAMNVNRKDQNINKEIGKKKLYNKNLNE